MARSYFIIHATCFKLQVSSFVFYRKSKMLFLYCNGSRRRIMRFFLLWTILKIVRTVFAPRQARGEESPRLRSRSHFGEANARENQRSRLLGRPKLCEGGRRANDNFKFFFASHSVALAKDVAANSF